MKRSGLVALIAGVPLAGVLVYWIAANTYWADVTMPLPPKGEAVTNPFYAAQRFAETLGARTTRARDLGSPSSDSVIVVSAFHWSLSRSRRDALVRWTDAGGRLVLDRTVVDSEKDFERWSGIARSYARADETPEPAGPKYEDSCPTVVEESRETAATFAASYEICDLDRISSLTADEDVVWALRDKTGIQAIRVQAGRGSVTMINANPFRHRSLLDGDHARLLVAATQLRRGDEVQFLSDDDSPWLIALAWRHGAPVVLLALALIALALWRDVVRFGPLAAPEHAARRSLAEQIRGTGRFALRQGGGAALHAASVRALDEAAKRRVKTFAGLPANERTTALARLTGFDPQAMSEAVHAEAGVVGSHQLRHAIELLESARRQIVLEHTRSSHGRT
jgi:uncharacterized protein DUF4350